MQLKLRVRSSVLRLPHAVKDHFLFINQIITVLIIFVDAFTYSACNGDKFLRETCNYHWPRRHVKLVCWFCGDICPNAQSFSHGNLLMFFFCYWHYKSQPFILPSHTFSSPSLPTSVDTYKIAELSRAGLNKNGYCQCMQWLPHECCLVLRPLYSTLQLRRYCSFPIQLEKFRLIQLFITNFYHKTY